MNKQQPSRFEILSYVNVARWAVQDQLRVEKRKGGEVAYALKKGHADRFHYAAWLLELAAGKLRER